MAASSVSDKDIRLFAVINNSSDTISVYDKEIGNRSKNLTGDDSILAGDVGNTGALTIGHYKGRDVDHYVKMYNADNEDDCIYVWSQEIDDQWHIYYDYVTPVESSGGTQLDDCDGTESALAQYWTITITGASGNYQLVLKLVDTDDLSDQAKQATSETYAEHIKEYGSAFLNYYNNNGGDSFTKGIFKNRENPGTSSDNAISTMLASDEFSSVSPSDSGFCISLGGEGEAGYFIGFDIAGGLFLDVTNLTPYGFLSVNGTIGVQEGVSIGGQLGFWFYDPQTIQGFGMGITLGIDIPTGEETPSVEVAISAAFGFVEGDLKLTGITISLGIAPPSDSASLVAFFGGTKLYS